MRVRCLCTAVQSLSHDFCKSIVKFVLYDIYIYIRIGAHAKKKKMKNL